MKIRAQIAMVLNLDKCIGCHTCSVTCMLGDLQERLDQPRRRRIRLVQQCRNQAGDWLSQGMGKSEEVERGLDAQVRRRDRAENRRQMAGARQDFRQSGSPRNRRLLRALHLRLSASPNGAREQGDADRAAAIARFRRAHGEDRVGSELGRNSRRRIRQAFGGHEFRGCAERNLRRLRKHLHDVSAAAVRALPQSGMRRRLSVGRHLQARGGWRRSDRPGGASF